MTCKLETHIQKGRYSLQKTFSIYFRNFDDN